jgi:signal transduction histidine kinase
VTAAGRRNDPGADPGPAQPRPDDGAPHAQAWGPPWAGGLPADPESREAWRRQWRRRRADGRPPRRAFGCLFGVVLLVVGSAFVVVASVLLSVVGLVEGGRAGVVELAAFVVLAVGVVAVVAMGRWLRSAARTLDDLVAAAARVEGGDYSARVAAPRRGPPPLRGLVHGFNTMAERLGADERQRRSLLADVSHELRTPLTVVQGNLEAIADGVHPADAEHLEAIIDQTRVLGRLVDDLRTVALSETGSLPLHREPTDLAVLIAEVAAAFAPAAGRAGVALTTDVEDDLPLLDVDPIRIREVLANLVANALRYTPSGGAIHVAAGTEPRDPEPARVTAVVSDTGSGIEAADLPHVFDRFWKSPESRGSGLGLAIARNLVLAHGGDIGATSQPGHGTTIRFTLPAP